MAGSDSHLLNLIHGFASDELGEICRAKSRFDELTSEVEVRNAELEDAKRTYETTEQEVRGYGVELAMNDATILTLELMISLTEEEVSAVGSEWEALKVDL